MRAYRSRPSFADDGPAPEPPATAVRTGSSSRIAARPRRAPARPSALAGADTAHATTRRTAGRPPAAHGPATGHTITDRTAGHTPAAHGPATGHTTAPLPLTRTS